MLPALLLAALSVAGEPRSVVLIVLDDVAAADCSTYGGPAPTPFLDMMAQHGVRFDRAYANPTCAPSRRAMMFGHWWASENGGQCPPAVAPNTPQPGEVSLAEALPGHSSAFIGKWHLGALGGYCAPALEGFLFSAHVAPSNPRECGGAGYSNWMAMTPGCGLVLRSDYSPRAQRDYVLNHWSAAPDPSLTVLSLSLAHGPFHVPPDDMLPAGYVVEPTPRGRFEAMIVAADRIVGGVLGAVDLSRTVVIVVGDNGTPEQVTPEPGRSKTTTFERGVRVPLLAVGAGVAPGAPSQALVHVVDLYATAVELGGGALPTGGPFQISSISLVPALEGSPFDGHDMVLLGHGWGSSSADGAVVRSDGLKLRLLDTNGDGAPDVEELYDLVADPLETVSVVDSPSHAAAVAAMRSWFLAERLP